MNTTESIESAQSADTLTKVPGAEVESELAPAMKVRGSSGHGPWPYADAFAVPLPKTMPGGKPWPRISVITPSFNQGQYIEQTILSVRNQGYPNLEHIVVDGGSSDQTIQVLDKYKGGFAQCISEPDDGQSDAINKGFALATGEIFTWLNSDDMLAPGALAAVAMAFHTSNADMIAGICEIYRDGRLEHRHLTSCTDGPLPLEDLLDLEGCWMKGKFFYQPEVMFTREIWERAGGQLDTQWRYSMDYELWLRLALAGAKLHVIGRPICHFRAHEEQKTAEVGGFRDELPIVRRAFLERTGFDLAPRGPTGSKRSLRIVLLNDLGYAFGAGIAHRRLAQCLREAGHEIHVLAAADVRPFQNVCAALESEVVARMEELNPDLVLVGNLHGAGMEPSLLGRVASRFTTVFTIHDLWLFTGRCAYVGDCKNYLTGCGEQCTCPKGHPELPPEQVQGAWSLKRSVLRSDRRPILFANSHWSLNKAREVFDHEQVDAPQMSWIKFGYELDTFTPRDQADCRRRLGLPLDKFIIMSSASSLHDARKGLAHLAEALERLNLPDLLVVCPGWRRKDEELPIPNMQSMGYMDEPDQLATLYSAVDLFVGPSLEEAFGQVFVEAAACGTPAIGYPIGGVKEAVISGVTGLLAEEVSPRALADAIARVYSDQQYRHDLGRWGRIAVENEWSMEASSHRFMAALRESGVAEQLDLAPKLSLSPEAVPLPEPKLLDPAGPAWRGREGFGWWGEPIPERNIGRFMWTIEPVASFELASRVGGPSRLLIQYRNTEPDQRVRLVRGMQVLGEKGLPSVDADRVVEFNVKMQPGMNRFDLHLWRWNMNADRRLGIMVQKITCEPR